MHQQARQGHRTDLSLSLSAGGRGVNVGTLNCHVPLCLVPGDTFEHHQQFFSLIDCSPEQRIFRLNKPKPTAILSSVLRVIFCLSLLPLLRSPFNLVIFIDIIFYWSHSTIRSLPQPNSTKSWAGLIFLCEPQNQTVCHFYTSKLDQILYAILFQPN